MSAISKIEWTDRTWNPVRGCALVSEGCRNCYAMKQAHRFSGKGKAYEGLTELGPKGPRWNGKIRTVPELLDEPLRWRKPAKVFVNSISDLFHEDVPEEFIDRVFAMMALTRHSFQVLTKRTERTLAYLINSNRKPEIARHANAIMRGTKRQKAIEDALASVFTWSRIENAEIGEYVNYLYGIADRSWPLPNVWLGASVEDQATANERIPLLLQTPAAVRFVSYEPALGPVDFSRWLPGGPGKTFLDWGIGGGESGPGARPSHPDWFRSVRDQCQAAGVAFFFKQWGAWGEGFTYGKRLLCMYDDGRYCPPTVQAIKAEQKRSGENHGDHNSCIISRIGKKRAGRLLDGREWNEFPCSGELRSPSGDGTSPLQKAEAS